MCAPGKTLIARQIGKMLNGREPKVVNGPEVLNKYVGASEENIRKLFLVRTLRWRFCSSIHMCMIGATRGASSSICNPTKRSMFDRQMLVPSAAHTSVLAASVPQC